MWEKFKQSKFASKFKNAGTSRAVYITVITLLLALAVLITATAISNRAKKNKDKLNPPVDDPIGEQTPPDQLEDDKGGNKPGGSVETPSGNTGTPSPDASGDKVDADKPSDEKPSDATISAVPELSLPVSGVIAKGHDNAIQVFSATTGDYRIHLGVDMTTAEDAPVMAAADGVVSQIWDDALMGKCLAISHIGDCYTIYKNLDNALPEDITVGASVTAGQQIGTVGETATLELAEEPHLHLEMTVKGLAVDPMDYFSAQALSAIGSDVSHETGITETE